jgi:hypothetical protein
LVLELEKGCLRNQNWKFHPSSVYDFDERAVREYDKLFLPKERGYKPTQEEYTIASNAFIE